MIADLISDSDGYAWSDRGRYAAAREQVLVISQHDGMDGRWKFRQVIRAALDHLDALDYVDGDHVAALGWCFGCHPILEMGMMQEDCVKCLISYHGVFDGVHMYQSTGVDKAITADDIDDDSKSKTNVSTTHNGKTRVLICNGKQDPFVPQDDMKKAKMLLQSQGCEVNILNFDGVRHGFTNPAQDYNPSDSFAFNQEAAEEAWTSTMQMLRESLSLA